MTTYRIPLLVWQDFDDGYMAAPVETHLAEEGMAAFADTSSDAVRQIQAYLAWYLKTNPWLVPDFFEPRLTSFRVSIRPEYRTQHRVYPCQQEVKLRVPCVLGCQANGLLQCSMPTLPMMFHFHEQKELQRMVAETVRRRLAGRTPQQLSRYLPPASVSLEVTSIRVPQTFCSRLGAGRRGR